MSLFKKITFLLARSVPAFSPYAAKGLDNSLNVGMWHLTKRDKSDSKKKFEFTSRKNAALEDKRERKQMAEERTKGRASPNRIDRYSGPDSY